MKKVKNNDVSTFIIKSKSKCLFQSINTKYKTILQQKPNTKCQECQLNKGFCTN